MRPDIFNGIRPGFGDNLMNYYKYMRDNDICATYTVLPPQGARKPELYQRADMKVPKLKVVDERGDGIVIDGMKMLGTSAVFADETWIGNLLPLGPGKEKESVTCAVPLNAPGVKMWSRKPFEKYAVSEFENPLAYRFDETDSMVIFDNVFVPWERVFTLEAVDLSREIYMLTPAHAMGNHQSNIRFWEKLKLIVGLANRVTEMNSIRHIPAVQGTLGSLAASLSGLEAMIHGQVEAFEERSCARLRQYQPAIHVCRAALVHDQPFAYLRNGVRAAGRRSVPVPRRYFGDLGSGDAGNLRDLLVCARGIGGRPHEGAQAGMGPAGQRFRRSAYPVRAVLCRTQLYRLQL